jgi:hypothetical protein
MKALLLLALVSGCHAVHAQSVYRCGPDGRSYSQAPCAHGRAVEVNDERSPQQQREALDVAERDRALADSLEQDRHAREAQPRAGAGKIDGRIGYARLAHAEPAKSSVKKKKRSSAQSPRHPDRYKATSAARS